MSGYADLSAGLGPIELVPGNLGEVEYLATNCAAYAEQLARTRQAISYIQLHGTAWTGRAADVYEAARTVHLEALKSAVLAFEVAAGALATYAIALRDARTQAGVARANFQTAQRARQSCGAATVPIGSPGVLRPVPPTVPVLPMTPEAAAAQLESARKSVRVAGEEAAKALRAAAALSPAPVDPDSGGIPLPGDLLKGLGHVVEDTVTGPYHLVHGYLDTLTTSFKGLGLSQYAGSHGMPPPNVTPELHEAQGEWLHGAMGTLNLLGLGEAIGSTIAVRRLPAWTAPRRQLESKFKHASDFGITEPRGAAGFGAYEQALREFVGGQHTARVLGTYRGSPVILSYDVGSRLVVVQARDGAFVSGWRMTEAQLINIVERRSLGGG